MATAKKYIYASHFDGMPKRSDLELVEEKLPSLSDGEFLCEAVWLSVDPYMRLFAKLNMLKIGETMVGSQVAKVVESKNNEYKVGDHVVGSFGWRNKTISDGKEVFKLDQTIYTDNKLSAALGILGMPGATAYFAFVEECRPKEGETVVVNAAAGAVGSAVGQLAKIKKCRVVGFAGSDEKVAYLKSLGFDEAFNYKTISSLKETLQQACPKGIDMFYDNVGGEFYDTVLPLMNVSGRVLICGTISQYNLNEAKGPYLNDVILAKELTIQGFSVFSRISRWPEAFVELNKWIEQGVLKYDEHVTEGFENMFDAFVGVLVGKNMGKAVVKA